MKKIIAFLLAALLLVGATACGDDTRKPDKHNPTTTVTTQPDGTDVFDGSTTAPSVPASSENADATQTAGDSTAPTRPSVSTGAATSTTLPAPTGATVPIGTKPPVTTTQTPTTTTTVASPSVGGSTSATPSTSTAPTTTPSTTVKPTEPVVQGPYIVLPAIGSDIDVTKKKDRIRVSGVAAWFNEDGTIGVQLTFKNYTSNWITEETDYVTYTCYDKNGNVVKRATNLMIGVIDTKKHVEKTFTFNVPANTAEVRITKSKITYWTEWA
ncbi:MAG: hypothetical protein IKA50_05010 [Clostridia bacterium]|nr:hypothetical protein [Clostridia bacterium]